MLQFVPYVTGAWHSSDGRHSITSRPKGEFCGQRVGTFCPTMGHHRPLLKIFMSLCRFTWQAHVTLLAMHYIMFYSRNGLSGQKVGTFRLTTGHQRQLITTFLFTEAAASYYLHVNSVTFSRHEAFKYVRLFNSSHTTSGRPCRRSCITDRRNYIIFLPPLPSWFPLGRPIELPFCYHIELLCHS